MSAENLSHLAILLCDSEAIAPSYYWRDRMKELIARHAIPVAAMDFPTNWQQLPIWQETTA